MDSVFIKLLNMSLTASWLVLAALLFRFIFKKAPKWIMGVLWGLVGVRLLVPISFQSIFSIIPSAEPIPQNIIISETPAIESGLPLINEVINPIFSGALAPNVGDSANPMQIVTAAASFVWVVGMGAMLLYAIISYAGVRRRVAEATPLKDNIWVCDRIATPFILGMIRPRIYLPSAMSQSDWQYVLSHERAHLKRKDYIWKPLGFLLLSVYWFNPIMWLAYVLLCKDIELACDERVIRQSGEEIKKPYSDALINCSAPRKIIAACPLAFGETGIKERVKGVLSYKKPTFWVIIAAVVICVVTALCLMTNPTAIRITQIDEGPNLNNLFEQVNEATIVSGERSFTITDRETVAGIVGLLQEVEIKSRPISQSLGEDRDMTNRIRLGGKTLCFSADYSALWVDTGVVPTRSYRVLNPTKVRSAFEAGADKGTTESFTVVDRGSDIDGVSLSFRQVELDTDKPYLQLVWSNDSKAAAIYPESFDILYYQNGSPSSCAAYELAFDAIANALPPGESRIKSYDVDAFNLAKGGRYRFEVEHEPGKYTWIEFVISVAE